MKRRDAYFVHMTQATAQILNEAEQLSLAEREELADRLMESLIRDIPPGVQRAHLAEVRRRIAQVDSGEVSVVPGDAALEQVRRLVGSASAER
jgi:hypothetical protein